MSTTKSIERLQGIDRGKDAQGREQHEITHVQLNTGPEWVAVADLECWRCGKKPAPHIVLTEGETPEQCSGAAFCSPACEEIYMVIEAPDGASESTHYHA